MKRCLAGAPAAWSELYQHCHTRLTDSIKIFLGRPNNDASVIDEIAARVWYLLVRNDFELLGRFDPERGCRLNTFLAVLAKNETRQLLRSERRRRVREQTVSRRDTDVQTDSALSTTTVQDFLATLTPAELAFYQDALITQPDPTAERQYSQSNTWQLTHRVRRKLSAFLLQSDS